MKRVSLAIYLLATHSLPGSDAAAAWQPLFDGTTLAGWNVRCKPEDQSKAYWRVEHGCIVADSMDDPEHDYVWLETKREFGDFELRLKFQAFRDSPGNSGVQIRSRYDEGAGWLDGPQLDIHPPGPWRTGMIYDETRGVQKWIAPALEKVRDAKPEMAVAGLKFHYNDDSPAWNDLQITARGTHLRAVLNGVLVRDWDGAGVLDDATHRGRKVGMSGHLALQIHKGDRLRMRFKDLSLREVGSPTPTSYQKTHPEAAQSGTTKPNILFILTEDQGAHTGFLGTPGLQTPNMDSLARTGVSFTNAFVAYPVCSASKASIYTGLHNHANGLLNNTENFHKPASELTPAERKKPIYVTHRIHGNLPTLVERLREADYYQGVTSKLHVSPNEKFPYDEFIIATNGATATAFIQRAKKAGKPWHLFYNVSNSHRPYPNSDKVKIRVDPAQVKLPAYLPDTPVVRKDWAEYLAGIEQADALIGQALEALKTSGDADNTIVIFLGDHGPTFQHGKMTLYDLGLRTPLVIRAPGLKVGIRSDALVSELDLTPTLLDLLGLAPLPKTHGISIKPLLAGTPGAKGHNFIFAEIANRASLSRGMQERSVFEGRWKLIYRENLQPAWRQVNADSKEFKIWGNRTYAETVKFKARFPEPYRILTEMDPQNLEGNVPAIEFYDLRSDPDEMRNLANDSKSRPELKRLYAALRHWVDETNDTGVKPPVEPPNHQ